MKKNKIMVALSGGIDSIITALLLKKSGFYIEAIFMKNWESETQCDFKIDLIHVKNICLNLNIKFHVLNLSKEYWNFVFIKFLRKLTLGETPNPDILCNKKIKFRILLIYIKKKLKFNFLATGHYAKIKYINNINFLEKSFDIKKDQTYFLNKLNKKILKHIIFPLSNYSKKKIKIISKKYKFINFNKKDSMGICFIGKKKFSTFIKNFLPIKSGYIKTESEKIIGKHNGLFLYTIGQKIFLNTKRFYVLKKNIKSNNLYVTDLNNIKLSSYKFIISGFNFYKKITTPIVCLAKIRHKVSSDICVLKKHNHTSDYIIIFKLQQKFLSIGQHIVFYTKNTCIGGGELKKIIC